MRRAALGAFLIVFFVASTSRANGPLGPQGSAITTSDYAVDLFQGPVLASNRVTGLAGAYVPIAEGAESDPVNPAAPAVRVPWSNANFDWDFNPSITFPSSIVGTDFYNNGSTRFTYSNFIFLTLGLNLTWGHFGVGVNAQLQQYNLGQAPGITDFPNLQISFTRVDLLLAYGFFDDQLVLGVGARSALLDAKGTGGSGPDKDILTMSGSAPEAGIVWAPKPWPVRVGVAARAAVESRVDPSSATQPNAMGDTLVGAMYLPTTLSFPAEAEAGVAVQFGPRALNLGYTNWKDVPKSEICREQARADASGETEKETALRLVRRRYAAVPRRKLLLVSSVLVTGPTENAVGFESFLSQRVDRSGARVTVTPRLGAEAEAIENLLQVRVGSYLEPTRYSESAPRIHGTTGFDVRTFEWTAFGLLDPGSAIRAGASIDLAHAYFGWGLSIGVWH